SLVAPVTAYVDESVLIDARDSQGISKRQQADGTPSGVIDFGDGFTCNLSACGHAYRTAGKYEITVTAKDSKGVVAVPIVTSITVAEIPPATGLNTNDGPNQNLIDMTASTGNPLYHIPANAYRNSAMNARKLQLAIKRASANNVRETQEIVLPAGAIFAGPLVLNAP